MYLDDWVDGGSASYSIANQIIDTFIQTKKAYKEGILDIEEVAVICRTLKGQLKGLPPKDIGDEIDQIKEMINSFVKKEKSKQKEEIALQ